MRLDFEASFILPIQLDAVRREQPPGLELTSRKVDITFSLIASGALVKACLCIIA